jgi:hypothetical protein
MQMSRICDRYVIARENNVVRVDFARGPDPPTPQFPGAGALRNRAQGSPRAEHNRPALPIPIASRPAKRLRCGRLEAAFT